MQRFIILIAVALLGLSCQSNPTKATTANKTESSNSHLIPLKDFFKNAEKSSYRLSRDGKMIAFIQPYKNRRNIFIQNLDPQTRLPVGEVRQMTFIDDRDLSGFFWKESDTILFSRDFGGDENFHVFAIDVKSGSVKDVTPFEKVRASVMDDLEDISSTDVLIQMNKRNPEIFDVYRLNVKTGDLKMVAENPGKFTGWLTDHKGEIRLASESDGLKTKIYYRKNQSAKFKKVLEFDYKNDFDPLFFSFDNKDLYASSNLNRDKKAIVKINPETGKEVSLIYQNPQVDVNALYYSKKRKVITATSFETWKTEYKFFDKTSEKRFKRLQKEFGKNEVMLTSTNKDEDLFTVAETSDKIGARFYLYNQKTDKLTFLADATPWLKPELLADVKPIEYKSRDGLTIHGYITLPKNPSEIKKLIVNPHGGPWYRDSWGYDPETQFLANRGYAVLQMNFRGSTGYGKRFFTKAFKQWGKKMQDDITDGVKWAIKKGYADPKKVCIYGGSYGGYAVLAGLAFTPDLYACGIDYVGVSNLLTFMKSIPPYWKPMLIKMYAMVGDPAKDLALMKAASPVFHADKIKAPLLVAQGAKDPRVNINESNQIVDSLRKRGVDVKYIVKDNEGHGFHNEENRFDFYNAMEDFLSKHL